MGKLRPQEKAKTLPCLGHTTSVRTLVFEVEPGLRKKKIPMGHFLYTSFLISPLYPSGFSSLQWESLSRGAHISGTRLSRGMSSSLSPIEGMLVGVVGTTDQVTPRLLDRQVRPLSWLISSGDLFSVGPGFHWTRMVVGSRPGPCLPLQLCVHTFVRFVFRFPVDT